MTFYWWSHWFWITLLSNALFPLIVVVHTYPSQESVQEYNYNREDISKKIITKLYQSTTVLSWATEETPITTKSTTTEENLRQQHIEQIQEVTDSKSPLLSATNNEEEEYYYEEDTTEDVNHGINLEQMEAELERKEEKTISLHKDSSENDVKRSAEIVNKAVVETKTEIKSPETSTPFTPAIETNNYTNFTDKILAISTNTTASILNTTVTRTATTNSSSDNSHSTQKINTTTDMPSASEKGLTNDTTTILPLVPETPKIVKAQAGTLDWLNTVAAHLPPAHVTTDDGAHDYPGDQHKIPFTLENVNKPEDLRREESEHRTRKSKGLSAEYKVNRYINYSSDSKNLLTRSAATTVNEYDSEESNISSEALSVQRAYYMDVGAISAICFTVFGICCTVGTVGIVLYRRRFLNKPQALSEPDSSVYIDDSTMRVSDNSDEMYSLDNDSFLNSLEAMTIQNYWTDTVKHTKL